MLVYQRVSTVNFSRPPGNRGTSPHHIPVLVPAQADYNDPKQPKPGTWDIGDLPRDLRVGPWKFTLR